MSRINLLLATCIMLVVSSSAIALDRDVILVLDNSGSMKVNDPQRLTQAAVTDFIRNQDPTTRVGIIVFADNPTLVVPLTETSASGKSRMLASLSTLNYSGQWTDTAAAIERGIYELRLNGRPGVDRAIILMTDGIIDTGVPSRDQEKVRWLRENLSKDAARNGIRIFGLAFTEKADYLLLQSLAQVTDGDYFRTTRPQDLGPALNLIDRTISQPRQTFAQPQSIVRSQPTQRQPVQSQPERIQFEEPVTQQAPVSSTGIPQRQPPTSGTQPIVQDQAPLMAGPDERRNVDDGSGMWKMTLFIAAFLVVASTMLYVKYGEALSGLIPRRVAKTEDDHGPKAVLYDVYDPSDIKRYELSMKPVVIGRVSGSDPAMDYIVVDERTVGRWHATIERRGQSFWIRDEGSVNGTFINDQRVTTEHPLKHGDMVRVHRHEFEFVIPELFDSEKTMLGGDNRKAAAAGESA
ncbi:MAG: VWA domain-containing protein [Gammaproteobacteria bacterium]